MHVVLHLPHAFRVKAHQRLPVTLRVRASAPGHDPATCPADPLSRDWPRSSLSSPRTSASGPRCRSLSGLMTDRIVWTTPSAMSSEKTLMTRPFRSWTTAPGCPFTSCSCSRRRRARSICAADAARAGGATRSRPTIGRGQDGLVPPPSPYTTTSAASSSTSAVDVAAGDGLEEAFGEPFALLPRRLEARLLLVDVAPCPGRELAAVVLALADRCAATSVVAVGEDVVQQEDRALDRGQLLEQDAGTRARASPPARRARPGRPARRRRSAAAPGSHSPT